MASRESEQCCTLPPFQSDYEPVGSVVKIDVRGAAQGRQEMDLYVTGKGTSGKGLVAIYDIFGFRPNTLQGADHLAGLLGLTIAIPDVFRGQAWDPADVPPKVGRPAMQAHIQSIGAWDLVRPDLLSTVAYLQSKGIPNIGAYGFCFGGKKLAQAAAAGEHLFAAVALVHPTSLAMEDGDLFTVPVALIPSGGEDRDVMNGVWERLQQKHFAGKCVRKDFLDVHHGFASARSDWKDPYLAGRAREAYEVMAQFFEANL